MAMQAFNQMDPNESVSSSASPMSSPENQHMKNAFNQIVDPNESGISSASPMNSPEDQNMDMSDVKNASNQSNIDPNESGYCSANDQSPMRVIECKEEDSLSTPMKKPKLEEFNEELSHYENWKTESRPIKISFRNVDYNWETSSEESIGDWVKRNISEAIKKSRVPNMDQLILRNSHGSVINLGWKTCILNEEENYNLKCEFRPNNNHKMKSELCRKDFPDLIDFSEVKSFTVESKCFPACYLHKKCLQVNFVPGEKIYDALCRDGRFDKDKVRSYDLQYTELTETQKRNRIVMLSAQAANYTGKYFEFSKRPGPNDTLQLQPYHKEHCGKPEDRVAIKSEHGPTLRYQVKAGTSGNIKEDTCKEQCQEGQHHKIITKITCDQELLDFIGQEMLKVKVVSENKKEVTKKLNKYFKANFNNYALKDIHHLYTADHEFIVDVCHSVGAVVALYTSREEKFKGTCFRIGKEFVITNMHVVDLVNDKPSHLENVYIDFDHEETSRKHRVFLCDRHQYSKEGKFVPVVSSTDLDYAVLKLVPMGIRGVKLPPSLTGMFGLPIGNQHLQEGTFLTFVGHPNGDKTATNLLCPIRNPENLDVNVAMLLSQRDKVWLSDRKVETYDVSSFLYGASGSPGFLLSERLLAVMHTRGACLDQSNGRTVEQGLMISAIMSDVWCKITSGLLHCQFQDLFDIERPQWTISS